MPFREDAASALTDWRLAEQDMLESPEGSPAWHDAALRAAAARSRYQAAVDGARAAHGPEPPPLDEVPAG